MVPAVQASAKALSTNLASSSTIDLKTCFRDCTVEPIELNFFESSVKQFWLFFFNRKTD